MLDTSPDASPEAIAQAAARLIEAARTHAPCPPVRELIGATDIAAAYAVQERLTSARLSDGARIVGRKIGLTSAAVQAQIGVDQPDFGVLFDDMGYAEADEVPMSRLLQPKAEAEVAFVLKEDLAEGDIDVARVRGAIDYAVASLETEMTMAINGEQVSTGNGAACLGDPLNAVVWLATTARDFGEPLRAGQVILSGALGPMAAVSPGDVVTAEITGLGSVTARFSQPVVEPVETAPAETSQSVVEPAETAPFQTHTREHP